MLESCLEFGHLEGGKLWRLRDSRKRLQHFDRFTYQPQRCRFYIWLALSLSGQRLQFGLIQIIARSNHCILTKQFYMTAFHSCPRVSQKISLIQLGKLFPTTTGWAPSCSFPRLITQCTVIKQNKTMALQRVQVMFNPLSGWHGGQLLHMRS